jgi:hypothetical protein
MYATYSGDRCMSKQQFIKWDSNILTHLPLMDLRIMQNVSDSLRSNDPIDIS